MVSPCHQRHNSDNDRFIWHICQWFNPHHPRPQSKCPSVDSFKTQLIRFHLDDYPSRSESILADHSLVHFKSIESSNQFPTFGRSHFHSITVGRHCFDRQLHRLLHAAHISGHSNLSPVAWYFVGIYLFAGHQRQLAHHFGRAQVSSPTTTGHQSICRLSGNGRLFGRNVGDAVQCRTRSVGQGLDFWTRLVWSLA